MLRVLKYISERGICRMKFWCPVCRNNWESIEDEGCYSKLYNGFRFQCENCYSVFKLSYEIVFQYSENDKDVCKECGAEINYSGEYWLHLDWWDRAKGHHATPTEDKVWEMAMEKTREKETGL